MVRFVSSVAGALAVGLLQMSVSFAGGVEMVELLSSMEGTWRGQGTVRNLQNDGSFHELDYRGVLRVSDAWGDEWKFQTETHFNNGVVRYDSGVLGVRGDLLFAGQYQPTEPVTVIDSTPTLLIYTFKRADYYTGRVYDYTFSYEIVTEVAGDNSVAEPLLRAYHTVSLNGVLVSENSWVSPKW